jgi:cell wall assembly regulator SMI1
LHDGGSEWSWILGYGELLTLDAITKWRAIYRELKARGEYTVLNVDYWSPQALDSPIKPIFWNVKRLFLTDYCLGHLNLDLDPPAEGHYGQVLDHSEELGPEKVLAPSWSAFLSQLADDLETGKYVYVKDTDFVIRTGMTQCLTGMGREPWLNRRKSNPVALDPRPDAPAASPINGPRGGCVCHVDRACRTGSPKLAANGGACGRPAAAAARFRGRGRTN